MVFLIAFLYEVIYQNVVRFNKAELNYAVSTSSLLMECSIVIVPCSRAISQNVNSSRHDVDILLDGPVRWLQMRQRLLLVADDILGQ